MKINILNIVRIVSLLVLAIVGVSLTAQAQNQPKQTGYLGKGKDQYSVFIFGDALAGGLWAGSSRIAVNHPRIKLNGRYREGSGLAKPQLYNWAKRLPATLASQNIDIAIVLIGTNDAQDIRREGSYLVFNSDQWREVYTKAVAKMMSQLTSNKTAVYWVEVPPVSRPKLDKKLKIIGDIHRREAGKAGIRFVKLRKFLTTSDGKFSFDGFSIAGTKVRLRSRNGIRFIKAGNDKIATLVIEQIQRDIAIADGERPVKSFPVPDSSKIASKEIAPYKGPIFGSLSSDKSPLIIEPDNMPLAGAGQSTNVLVSLPAFGSKTSGTAETATITGDAALALLKKQITPASPAGTLFYQGTWPPRTPGRLDDFTQISK